MDNVIDLLLLKWNEMYPELEKEKKEHEDDQYDDAFSKKRKEMNEIVEAVVLLYSHKRGRP